MNGVNSTGGGAHGRAAGAPTGALADLLERCAARFEAHTVLERIVGRATGPACGGLAAQGKVVVTVVDPDASSERVRMAYGLKADVRVAGNDDVVLPKSDLVVLHGGKPLDWQSTLVALGKLATRALVVVAENPGTWPDQARALFTWKKDASGVGAPSDWGRTSELAPVLWAIGRVREHEFLDVPSFAAPSSRFARFASRLAPSHAFVVDVTPRSPQARRRLRLGT